MQKLLSFAAALADLSADTSLQSYDVLLQLCQIAAACPSAVGCQCHDTVCRAVSKESQNRYSKSAKDWGWREFLQLHTLFDQEAGFLVSDSVVFAAEVLVLKEVSEVKQVRHSPRCAVVICLSFLQQHYLQSVSGYR